MERLDFDLNAFSRRAGSVDVAHSATALERGLEPGERVLVRAGEEHVLATVRDISFDLTDTHYRLELGATVATEDVAVLHTDGARSAGTMDVADLLSLLRDARQLATGRSYLADVVTR